MWSFLRQQLVQNTRNIFRTIPWGNGKLGTGLSIKYIFKNKQFFMDTFWRSHLIYKRKKKSQNRNSYETTLQINKLSRQWFQKTKNILFRILLDSFHFLQNFIQKFWQNFSKYFWRNLIKSRSDMISVQKNIVFIF